MAEGLNEYDDQVVQRPSETVRPLNFDSGKLQEEGVEILDEWIEQGGNSEPRPHGAAVIETEGASYFLEGNLDPDGILSGDDLPEPGRAMYQNVILLESLAKRGITVESLNDTTPFSDEGPELGRPTIDDRISSPTRRDEQVWTDKLTRHRKSVNGHRDQGDIYRPKHGNGRPVIAAIAQPSDRYTEPVSYQETTEDAYTPTSDQFKLAHYTFVNALQNQAGIFKSFQTIGTFVPESSIENSMHAYFSLMDIPVDARPDLLNQVYERALQDGTVIQKVDRNESEQERFFAVHITGIRDLIRFEPRAHRLEDQLVQLRYHSS